MGLFAARAANRMATRSSYRTMARMQRRRSAMQSSMGMHQDFQQRDDGYDDQGSKGGEQQMAPDYTAELEQLASLNKQGILTDEEYSAKKKQLLGI